MKRRAKRGRVVGRQWMTYRSRKQLEGAMESIGYRLMTAKIHPATQTVQVYLIKIG